MLCRSSNGGILKEKGEFKTVSCYTPFLSALSPPGRTQGWRQTRPWWGRAQPASLLLILIESSSTKLGVLPLGFLCLQIYFSSYQLLFLAYMHEQAKLLDRLSVILLLLCNFWVLSRGEASHYPFIPAWFWLLAKWTLALKVKAHFFPLPTSFPLCQMSHLSN